VTQPAIRSKTLPHVSASQIATFRMCPRKWFFRYYRPDIQEEPDPALELGTAVHGALEAHYETGTLGPITPPPDADEKVRASYAYAAESAADLVKHPDLPPRTGDVRVEFPRSYQLGIEAAGVPVKGRIDVLWATGPDSVRVHDHKTLSSWKRAKTAEELEHDVQCGIYGKYVVEKIPAVQSVTYSHGQVWTKGVGADVVVTRPLTRDEVLAKYTASVEPTVRQMADVYALENPDDVPYDAGQCNAFNRLCPYYAVCDRDIFAAMTTATEPPTEGGSTVSISEKLRARAAQKAAVPAAPAVPPTEPAAPLASTGVLATGINPPDATVPPKAGATTTTSVEVSIPTPSVKARLVLTVGGTTVEVDLPVKVL
jgi:hypothetical protein